jgi:hypothetical protein
MIKVDGGGLMRVDEEGLGGLRRKMWMMVMMKRKQKLSSPRLPQSVR